MNDFAGEYEGMRDMRERLTISTQKLEEINRFLVSEQNTILNPLVDIVEKYGGVKEINRKAHESRKIENLLNRLETSNSPFLNDLNWLQEQRDDTNFVSLDEYKKKILVEKTGSFEFDESLAVTLEISACNFFPVLVEEAKYAIDNEDLMQHLANRRTSADTTPLDEVKRQLGIP